MIKIRSMIHFMCEGSIKDKVILGVKREDCSLKLYQYITIIIIF